MEQIKLTLQQLKNAESCDSSIIVFKQLFIEEADLTLENLKLFEKAYYNKYKKLPYFFMCYLLNSISPEIFNEYCNINLNNEYCNICSLNNCNTTEDRFNILLQILKENGFEVYK